MFVVHTVNQLEEAVRVGAEEILVTGMLAKNVHEASLLKACQDGVAVPEGIGASEGCGESSVWGKMGRPSLEISTLLMLTTNFATLDAHFDPKTPSVVLQRQSEKFS